MRTAVGSGPTRHATRTRARTPRRTSRRDRRAARARRSSARRAAAYSDLGGGVSRAPSRASRGRACRASAIDSCWTSITRVWASQSGNPRRLNGIGTKPHGNGTIARFIPIQRTNARTGLTFSPVADTNRTCIRRAPGVWPGRRPECDEVRGGPENVDAARDRHEEWLQIMRDRKDRGDQLGAKPRDDRHQVDEQEIHRPGDQACHQPDVRRVLLERGLERCVRSRATRAVLLIESARRALPGLDRPGGGRGDERFAPAGRRRCACVPSPGRSGDLGSAWGSPHSRAMRPRGSCDRDDPRLSQRVTLSGVWWLGDWSWVPILLTLRRDLRQLCAVATHQAISGALESAVTLA